MELIHGKMKVGKPRTSPPVKNNFLKLLILTIQTYEKKCTGETSFGEILL